MQYFYSCDRIHRCKKVNPHFTLNLHNFYQDPYNFLKSLLSLISAQGIALRIISVLILTCEKRQITIDNLALKRQRQMELSLTDTNLIVFSVCAIFLPYVLSGLVIIFLALYIVVNSRTRKLVFIHKGSAGMKIFLALAVLIPIYYHNLPGLMAGLAIMLGMVLGFYFRSIMTTELYEWILSLICILSLTSTGYAITQEILLSIASDRYSTQRLSAVFFYPNYFGTITATVILICAYKLLTHQGHKLFICFIASMNIFCLYLCKSIFSFIEVFVGVAVLLFIYKKHKELAGWFCLAALTGLCIFVLHIDVIPRMEDVDVTLGLRFKIWHMAIGQIIKKPLIGHGFFTFMDVFHIYYDGKVIPHAHSLYLDSVLNYGIIGTAFLLTYFIRYYQTVIIFLRTKKEKMTTSLILAVSAAALVHGTTDITLLWIQTMPLFLIILSGLGGLEKQDSL